MASLAVALNVLTLCYGVFYTFGTTAGWVTLEHVWNFLKQAYLGKDRDHDHFKDKLRAEVDKQRLERAVIVITWFVYGGVILYPAIMILRLWRLCFVPVSDSWPELCMAFSDLVITAMFLQLRRVPSNPQLVTKTSLRLFTALILFSMLGIQITTGCDSCVHRVPHTVLRLLLGIVSSDLGFNVASNACFSFVFSASTYWSCWSTSRHFANAHEVAGTEGRAFLWIVLVMWLTQRFASQAARHSLELQASVGAQWSMWSLLECQYDAVVQLGSDLRIQRPAPRLTGLLAKHHDSNTFAPTHLNTPVSSFMPPPIVQDDSLEGCLLADFIESEADQELLTQLLSACANINKQHALGAQVLHVTMRDLMERCFPVSLFHAHFMDLSGTQPCHLVGICEIGERLAVEPLVDPGWKWDSPLVTLGSLSLSDWSIGTELETKHRSCSSVLSPDDHAQLWGQAAQTEDHQRAGGLQGAVPCGELLEHRAAQAIPGHQVVVHTEENERPQSDVAVQTDGEERPVQLPPLMPEVPSGPANNDIGSIDNRPFTFRKQRYQRVLRLTDQPLVTSFGCTGMDTMSNSIITLLRHWNCPRAVGSGACCPFHVATILASNFLANHHKRPCMPLWSPYTSWPCSTCACLNPEGTHACEICGLERDDDESSHSEQSVHGDEGEDGSI